MKYPIRASKVDGSALSHIVYSPISNCNNALHVSDAFCVHPQEHLKTVVTASGV